jgi:Flp pilus assembly protein TadG
MRNRQRGAVAVELGLSMPILVLTVFGGIQLSRALVTRHRLADAVSYATRSAAIAGQTSGAAIQGILVNRLGGEAARCNSLQVQSSVIPGAFSGGKALSVTVICALAPLMQGQPWTQMVPSQLTVTAAMPM